jgi:transposase-like protein
MECIKCNSKTQKNGKVNGKQRYQCIICNKSFTDSTISKLKEKEEKYEMIKKLYLIDRLSTTEIANILGVSPTIPQRILKKLGVTRNISESKIGKKRGSKLPVDKIIELYKSGISSTNIAKIINCSKRSVLNILIDNNINRGNTYKFFHNEIDKIKELYLSGNSMNYISDKLNIPYTTINNNLHKLGVVRTEDKHRLGMDYDKWLETLPVYKKYKSDVNKITNKQPIHNLENFEKRGISGVDGAYQLDHKYSIFEGFKQGIAPKIIGNIVNLEFIPWEINLDKGSNCSVTENELLTIYNKTNK